MMGRWRPGVNGRSAPAPREPATARTGYLPDPIVKDSVGEVWDRPELGVEFDVAKARERLTTEDAGFFD